MTRANVAITSFNAGELSPLLGGRPDLQKYQAGLSKCENFIPRVQGALTRRGGTRFVSEVKDSSKRTWLMPFVFSRQDAFLLEFGGIYIRFYLDRGVFLDDAEAIYEVASPWPTSKLVNADGAFALRFVQSGDVLYICHPEYQTRKLTRTTNTDWTLELYAPEGGPFQDMNETETTTVYASAGLVDNEAIITASSGIFTEDHVGGLFYIQMQDGSDIKPWEVYQPVAVGYVRSSDGKYYECTQVGEQATYFTGTEKPIHTSGKYWDGDGKDVDDDSKGALGAEWQYLHPGYGWVKISEFVSSTVVHGIVQSRLPAEVIGSGNTTWRWALPAWSDEDGWPSSVCFFRERLCFGKGQTVYPSQSGDFENMKAKDFGEQLASSAFQILIQSGRGDEIQWLAPTDQLLVGTGGSVHAVHEAATSAAFGPTNAAQKDQNMPPAGGVAPVLPDGVVYVDGPGRIAYEAGYSAEAGSYVGTDLTVFAEHVTAPSLIETAFAKTPHAVVWCVTSDGGLVGLTYHKAQNVIGWHRHPIGGNGYVEHVAVIPSPDGTRDDVWLIVKRTINGTTRRYVEYITPEYLDGDDAALSAYSDCHLIYDGTAASTITGLGHLEGKVVQVKANGAVHPDCTVSSGSITLNGSYAKVTVGLQADAKAVLKPIQAGAQMGTAQGQTKRFHKLWLRLLNCLGGKVGLNLAVTEAIQYRNVGDDMDAPPPIFSGLRSIEMPGGFEVDATIALLCDDGLPFTLTALVIEGATYES